MARMSIDPESLLQDCAGGTAEHHPGPLSARDLALRVLSDLREGRKTARESIHALVGQYPVNDQELRLATELVMGVVRHRLTLARVLDGFARHRWKRINRRLQDILLLGAYQLIWLDAIPEFAAVHSAVEQAKGEGGAPAGRFVNAVLRQLLREIESRRIPRAKADPARAIPIDAQTSCQFRRAVLPDPGEKRIEHLADATSHPAWLVSRWAKTFGAAAAAKICLVGMCRPPLVLRANPLRTDVPVLVARLQKEEIAAEATPDGLAVMVTEAAPVMRSRAFAEGLFQPQDRTSMEVVRQMSLSPGQVVLDLCAGLGTKGTQMAEIMRDRGTVIACDKEEIKLKLLRANCERLGLKSVRSVSLSELMRFAAEIQRLDWILIDAPCSNTGVLARRPEARYRLNARALESLSRMQLQLLEQAAGLARPQTRLLYSTCSIDPQENEQVSARFAYGHPDWRLMNSALTLPTAGTTPAEWRDGGYWAVWVRESPR